jgi:cytosine/adenosine deaminase-related metal-dependent hydrolase
MTLNERLDELAERGDGQITIGPDAGQDLEAFQATVALLRDYERSGYLIIVGTPHKESRTGHRYVDSVRARLTDAGIEWRKGSQR